MHYPSSDGRRRSPHQASRHVIAMQPSTEEDLRWYKQSNFIRSSAAAFILAIIWLVVPRYHADAFRHINHTLHPPPILTSPFDKTLAIIRWNHPHPERIPSLQKYEPFFHTVHYSMPGLVPDQTDTIHSDNAGDDYTIFREVANIMQLFLDQPEESPESEIESLLFFHFDAWLNPLNFASNDFNQMWLPYSPDGFTSSGGMFRCMNNKNEWPDWDHFEPPFNSDIHAMRAIEQIQYFNYPYPSGEFCVGWSDFYHIPRRFWADWIFLSGFFNDFGVFQEVAIPTMMHIIDSSRRLHPEQSVMTQLGECWGGCCTTNPTLRDVMTHKCGHKFNYPDAVGNEVAAAHYKRLDEQATMLGKAFNRTTWEVWQGKSLPDGEESLGSNDTFVKNLSEEELDGVMSNGTASEEVRMEVKGFQRAAKHRMNFGKAIKVYN